MKLKIKSKTLNREITFSRPGGSYIFADINGQAGTLGNQICHGGGLTGSTIGYGGDDLEEFVKICRRWYRAYVKNEMAAN